MQLLDLPTELFRAVLVAVVTELSPLRSLHLRRIFDNEILGCLETVDVFDLNSPLRCLNLNRISSRNRARQNPIIPFLVRFLQREPYIKHDPDWTANLSALLKRVLDELQLQPSARSDALRSLCESFDDFRPTRHGFYLVQCLKRPISQKPLHAHVLPAAILLKKPEIYEPLLSQMPDRWYQAGVFGTALYAAVRSRQLHLVRRFVEDPLCQPSASQHQVIHMAASNNDFAMMEYLLEWYDGDSDLIEYAICSCARWGHLEMARRLLEFTRSRHQTVPLDSLGEAWYWSAMYGEIAFMDLLVEYGHQEFLTAWSTLVRSNSIGQFWNHVRPIDLACWRGDVAMVRWMLDQGVSVQCKGPADANINRTRAAALGDSAEVFRILLDAGAHRGRHASYSWVAEAELAVKVRANKVFRFLLQESGLLKISTVINFQTTKDFRRLMLLACTYGNLEAFDILLSIGMPCDMPLGPFGLSSPWGGRLDVDEGFDSSWTPIMYAQATTDPGAQKIVDRLLQSGVEPLDVCKSSAARLFEDGVFPRRPAPVIHRLTEIDQPRVPPRTPRGKYEEKYGSAVTPEESLGAQSNH
ncbi:hypothetical protein JX266_010649 [Neoarthrinium moseri]|nr:hypothetical protein JX266_010649 [Neoarthrinium moseri]